ncbi:hypothetical protein NLG97_g8068 [Lecanicillium saksenae]|uniref:Uncharacterized protein n=1 Tax=Lecanicillium saksenae TaxID=468837 RepID=A0ACC1QJZ0_9HYPO|nr:hypothetical protein NLG97_g8068 [Lecanicillium saksenae]
MQLVQRSVTPEDDFEYIMFSIEGDDVAWEESDRLEKEWCENLVKPDTQQAIGNFVARHRQGIPTEIGPLGAGGFNALLRLKFKDGGSDTICKTWPKYIQDHTTIPVPFILHWGTKEESPLQIGPFIIMEYAKNAMNMTAAMNTPGRTRDMAPVLDANIDEKQLYNLYRQVSNILLQLSKLEFPAIGALQETDEWQWEVRSRPLSMPMNELVRTGSFPRAKLPTCTFQTSEAYYDGLALMNVQHLLHQRNDAIESEADCRRKYTARKLFESLVKDRKLFPTRNGQFKFWCDDLRPSNILLNDQLDVVAVIDREFSYAAPCDFTYSPPWWLLLVQPECWGGGLDDWISKYEPRVETFLEAVVDSEDDLIASGQLQEDQRLSGKMRESWDSGDFWICYAARKNFGFDCVYWEKLEHRFFGPTEGKRADVWLQRQDLLDESAKKEMDALVARKLEEMKSRELLWEPDE